VEMEKKEEAGKAHQDRKWGMGRIAKEKCSQRREKKKKNKWAFKVVAPRYTERL